MSKILGTARQTTSTQRVAEGVDVYLRMLRSGEIGIADLITILSLEGRVFTANVGVATSPVTFNALLTTTTFDLHVAVPSSVAIIPLELNMSFETYGTTSITEGAMQSGSGSVAGTTSTAVTPQSSNVSAGRTSACTIVRVADAGTAFTTNIKEIWRFTDQLAVTLATVTAIREGEPYNKRWAAKDSGVLDIVGPNQQLGIWAATQGGTGFISLKYAELPASAVN